MNKIFAIFLLIVLNLPAYSEIITGEIKYSEEIKSEQTNAINHYKYLIDPNFNENLYALTHNITEFQNRKLARFSDNTYGIIFFDDPLYSWYYSSNGRLINFTKRASETYPTEITKYKPGGSVVNKGIKISEHESLIYSLDGKLLAHWVNNYCYDANNNIIMTKKYEVN